MSDLWNNQPQDNENRQEREAYSASESDEDINNEYNLGARDRLDSFGDDSDDPDRERGDQEMD